MDFQLIYYAKLRGVLKSAFYYKTDKMQQSLSGWQNTIKKYIFPIKKRLCFFAQPLIYIIILFI